MVKRDPDTGQFVSSDLEGSSWTDFKRVSGTIAYTIPAADLAGGTGRENVKGGETEIIDFTPALENDEVYHVDGALIAASLGAPTTATAESSLMVNFEIGSDSEFNATTWQSPSFYQGSGDSAVGIVDVNHASSEAGPQWYLGTMYAEASLNDTTNGTGAGADAENMHEFLPFESDLGAGPVYDRDDSLYVPAEIHYDNISDHAVMANFRVMTYGRVETLD